MIQINLKDGMMTNAVLTGVTGLGLSVFSELATQYLMPGAPSWLVLGLGIALLLFAADVGMIAQWKTRSRPLVGFVFIADLLWVICVPAILVLMPSAFTSLGVVATVAVTAVVAVFALIEWNGLKHLQAA
ncbi:hypothetical protein QFZ34_002715 [Phyllobacterium ifriqiyense]|uniref:DUF2127 domain-containing protein n=1 Tax=Phyllobacterium ifriqiyense TaxID=314238 RepID=A0ABU0S9T7_9HYPH|nr:hypothetical protein [Phyllobacterium ifriqiyense]MDQ0997533.1 hypothetical protein [Phyllobacterium ifriqiyense]